MRPKTSDNVFSKIKDLNQSCLLSNLPFYKIIFKKAMVVLKKKKLKEFGQFRLDLLLKISYIPDFIKILIQGFKSYGQKKFFGDG